MVPRRELVAPRPRTRREPRALEHLFGIGYRLVVGPTEVRGHLHDVIEVRVQVDTEHSDEHDAETELLLEFATGCHRRVFAPIRETARDLPAAAVGFDGAPAEQHPSVVFDQHLTSRRVAREQPARAVLRARGHRSAGA